MGYLDMYGILLCNQNKYMPALEDIGCTWYDAVDMMAEHRLFYCKTFRKCTTYLSPKAYWLLKQARKPMLVSRDAENIYALVESAGKIATPDLKRFSQLPHKEYSIAFASLLEDMRVTALGKVSGSNPSWPTFLFGVSEIWEQDNPQKYIDPDNAQNELWELFGKTMQEKEFLKLLRKKNV